MWHKCRRKVTKLSTFIDVTSDTAWVTNKCPPIPAQHNGKHISNKQHTEHQRVISRAEAVDGSKIFGRSAPTPQNRMGTSPHDSLPVHQMSNSSLLLAGRKHEQNKSMGNPTVTVLPFIIHYSLFADSDQASASDLMTNI